MQITAIPANELQELTPDLAQARRHLELLGYSETEPVYLRTFGAKNLKRRGENFKRRMAHLPPYQEPDLAQYFVVHGQGQKKADIDTARALFCEFDGIPQEEQLHRILTSGLPEPSCQVSTRHSVHTYWTFSEPVPIADWEEMTLDLIAHIGSDPAVKDPSRVMRLAGYFHTMADKETGELLEPVQCELISDAGHRYSFQELREAIPRRPENWDKKPFEAGARVVVVETEAALDGWPAAGSQGVAVKVTHRYSPEDWAWYWEVEFKAENSEETLLLPSHAMQPIQQTRPAAAAAATVAPVAQVVDGSRQLSDVLTREILPRLSPETAFNWPGHNFQWSGDKARGCCPWHESQSGTAFHIEPHGDGGAWLWHCPSCDIGGGAVEYRHRLAGGNGSPRGREWVDIVKELAREAWVELPPWEPSRSTAATVAPGGAEEEPDPDDNIWRWNAPESWNGELGHWTEEGKGKDTKRVFQPLTNWDFQVERELSSPSGDAGLVLQVRRSVDGVQRRVVVLSKDRTRVSDFVAALTRAYGADLVCNLKLQDLNALIHVRLHAYHQRGGRVFHLADRVGRQGDGTMVFPNIQYTATGKATTEEESGWVFNEMLSAGEDTIPSPEPAPPDTQALPRLVKELCRFVGPEVEAQAMLTLGAGAAAIHYSTIMERERRFPNYNLNGDPGSFKTIMLTAGASLVGNHHHAMSRSSESAIYERLARCGDVVQILDDPRRSRDTDEIFKRLYNGEARVLRGVFQKPAAPLFSTSNHELGEDQMAILQRFASLTVFPTDKGDPTAWDGLQEAMDGASGALPQLLALGYPQEEIRATAAMLRPHLPQAAPRMADNWAIILWYAKAVARLGGYPEAALEEYVVNTVCPRLNISSANKPSLADFLERVESLVATGHAGGWNARAVVDKAGNELIAIYMPSVWPEVDRQFKPPYSRAILQAAIAKAGGSLNGVQRFYRTRDEALAYQRAVLAPRHDDCTPPQEPDTTPRKCVVIPAALAPELYLAIIPPSPEPLQNEPPAPPPPPQNGPPPEPPAATQEPVTSVTSCYPPVTSKGNSENLCPVDVSGSFSNPVTFSKNTSTLEKSDSFTGDTEQGEEENDKDNAPTFEKKVTDPPLGASNPYTASVSAVTFSGNTEVTEGNESQKQVTGAPTHRRLDNQESGWILSVDDGWALMRWSRGGPDTEIPLDMLEEV